MESHCWHLRRTRARHRRDGRIEADLGMRNRRHLTFLDSIRPCSGAEMSAVAPFPGGRGAAFPVQSDYA